jgi:hypothetical protein
MIFAEPDDMPETTPEAALTAAIALLLLVHVPPGVTSLNVVVPPIHTLATPEMATG